LKKFQRSILGVSTKIVVKDVDIRDYVKYILKEGQDIEKRELLGCLKSKVMLKNKIIYLN